VEAALGAPPSLEAALAAGWVAAPPFVAASEVVGAAAAGVASSGAVDSRLREVAEVAEGR